MKSRQCFVSNSSTSSFIVFGYSFSANDFVYTGSTTMSDEEWKESFSDYAENIGGKGLETTSYNAACDDDESISIGASPDKMQMDETKREFLNRVRSDVLEAIEKVPELQLKNIDIGDPGYIEMVWEDR